MAKEPSVAPLARKTSACRGYPRIHSATPSREPSCSVSASLCPPRPIWHQAAGFVAMTLTKSGVRRGPAQVRTAPRSRLTPGEEAVEAPGGIAVVTVAVQLVDCATNLITDAVNDSPRDKTSLLYWLQTRRGWRLARCR